MTTAERLKKLREESCLSQRDVARRLNVVPSLISAYESGERIPSPGKLVSLADIYQTTTDYLLCRKPAVTRAVNISLDGLNTEQIRIIKDLVEMLREKNHT